MNTAVDVVYRDLDNSASLNETIHKKVQKLSRYSSEILRSRVVLETPHNHKHKGKEYRASIELDVKGAPLVFHNDASSIHLAVRDAFNTAERKLKEVNSRHREH